MTLSLGKTIGLWSDRPQVINEQPTAGRSLQRSTPRALTTCWRYGRRCPRRSKASVSRSAFFSSPSLALVIRTSRMAASDVLYPSLRRSLFNPSRPLLRLGIDIVARPNYLRTLLLRGFGKPILAAECSV